MADIYQLWIMVDGSIVHNEDTVWPEQWQHALTYPPDEGLLLNSSLHNERVPKISIHR